MAPYFLYVTTVILIFSRFRTNGALFVPATTIIVTVQPLGLATVCCRRSPQNILHECWNLSSMAPCHSMLRRAYFSLEYLKAYLFEMNETCIHLCGPPPTLYLATALRFVATVFEG
jgi:hypothetical protein